MPDSARSFWVNTVSLDHVLGGVAGGFTQADHGASTRLRRLHPSDGLVFYSPRTALEGGETLQQFTALGTVTGAEPYQVTMSDGFRPWRLDVAFVPSTPTAAKPLVGDLAFVTDPARWGYPFRRGLFSIAEADFSVIASAMGASFPDE